FCSSRRRHTRSKRDWSSDVCSSDLNYTFSMQNAEVEFNFTLDDFPEISASVLKWPMSVIRLKGENRETLVQAGSHLLNTWKNYQDQEANIIPYTNDTSHNT